MKILHLTTRAAGNGPAVAIDRLHRGLIRSGQTSSLIALSAPAASGDPTVRLFKPSRSPAARARRWVRRRRIQQALSLYARTRDRSVDGMSDDRTPYGREVVRSLPACDVITVHAMMDFIDYRAFLPEASRRAPLVRVLHDMTFFTGGCHSDWGCGRFTHRCGCCPQLGSRDEDDPSSRILRRKGEALAAVPPGRLCVVAPSHWLADQARRSSLLRDRPVTVIPHGVDTDFYSPKARTFCREILNVPADRFVVLFVADPLTRAVKGFADLAAALAAVRRRRDLFLLSAGSGTLRVPIDVPHGPQGRVSDERLLQIVYSAADVLVVPSGQEAFGQTVIEAMACGTPVIGYDAGGVADTVRHGDSGLLVRPGDIAALAGAIDALVDDPTGLERMRARAREIAVAEYDVSLQVARFVRLYETVLAGGLPPLSYAPTSQAPAPEARAQAAVLGEPR